MGNAGRTACEHRNFSAVELDTMGVPDIGTRPTQIFRVLSGATPKMRLGIGNIFRILSQMCMHHYAFISGQNGRITHQFTADRKRRARRHANPQHRPCRGIVIGVDNPDAIVDDRVLALNQGIRRQPALRHANTHRAPRRVKPQAHRTSGIDGIIKPCAIGKEVQVIRTHRAAR